MADTTTTSYGLVKPEVGASNDSWGNKTNGNWDVLDATLTALSATTAAAMPKAGGAFTGGITGTSAAFSGAITQGGQQVWHAGNLTGAALNSIYGYTPYSSANPAGYITGISGGMVTSALGYTPYSSANPSGFINGISSGMVTGALGFTPYPNYNPSGFIAGINYGMVTGALGYAPVSRGGDTMSGGLTAPTFATSGASGQIQINARDGGSPFILYVNGGRLRFFCGGDVGSMDTGGNFRTSGDQTINTTP